MKKIAMMMIAKMAAEGWYLRWLPCLGEIGGGHPIGGCACEGRLRQVYDDSGRRSNRHGRHPELSEGNQGLGWSEIKEEADN